MWSTLHSEVTYETDGLGVTFGFEKKSHFQVAYLLSAVSLGTTGGVDTRSRDDHISRLWRLLGADIFGCTDGMQLATKFEFTNSSSDLIQVSSLCGKVQVHV